CELSVALFKGARILLRQRGEKERWAGMWDFVRFTISDHLADQIPAPPIRTRSSSGRGAVREKQRSLFGDLEQNDSRTTFPPEVADQISQATGLTVHACHSVAEIRHVVTRYRIRLICIRTDVVGGRILRGSGYQWRPPRDLNELPLSRTAREFAGLL
ncbi:MAG: NUDIX domain-containing protein, partial [Planctomycetaceae bacterium]|nr:NUDIX domain-containing protein [Planctomycetaceae bacterium]